MIAHVLLLTFFLKGGLVESKSIVAPSHRDCLVAELDLTTYYMKQKVFVTNGHMAVIEDIEAQCIDVKKAIAEGP